MSGRANGRAEAARAAANARIREAARRLRDGGEVGDQPGAREAAARLLEHLADQAMDVHTFDRAAGLADRILARNPYRAMDDGFAMPSGHNHGQPRRDF